MSNYKPLKQSDQVWISFTTLDEILLAELGGTLDSRAAGPVYDALVQRINESACRLIIDMSGVTRLTRAGVRGLVVAAKLCVTAGGKMRICGADPAASHLLDSLGFHHILRLEPSVETAMIALCTTQACRIPGPVGTPPAWPEGSVTESQFKEIGRVEQARGLLDKDALPIRDVVTRCGFTSLSAMESAFLRHLGIPPSCYAERAPKARDFACAAGGT